MLEPHAGSNELPAVLAAWGLRNSSPRGRDRTPTPTGVERAPIGSPAPSILGSGIHDGESGRHRHEDKFAIDWLSAQRRIVREELDDVSKNVQDVAKRQVTMGKTASSLETHLVDLRQIILEAARIHEANHEALTELIAAKFAAQHDGLEQSFERLDERCSAISQAARSINYSPDHDRQEQEPSPKRESPYAMIKSNGSTQLFSAEVHHDTIANGAVPVNIPHAFVDARERMIETKLALQKGSISDVHYEDFVEQAKLCAPTLHSIVEAVGWQRSLPPSEKNVYDESRCSFPVLRRIMGSSTVYSFVLSMILLNCITIAWQVDEEMDRALHGYYSSGEAQQEPTFYKATDIIFCCFYSVELVLRILAEESYFVRGRECWFNILDLVVVVAAILELTAVEALPTLLHLRLIRILRVVRVFRIVKALRFLRVLRVMFITTVHNVISLWWAFVYIFFVIFIFSAVFLQVAATFVEDAKHNDLAAVKRLQTHFDTMPQSLCTLFMSVSGGVDWSMIYDSIKHIGDFWGLLFIFYVAVITIGVMNVIVGIFVKEVGSSDQLDRDMTVAIEMEEAETIMEELRGELQQLDVTDFGALAEEELTQFLESPVSKKFLRSCDIDLNSARALYKLLESKTGEAPIDEFVVGLLILKGGKSIHMAKQWYDTKQLMLQVGGFMKYSREHFIYIEQLLRHLHPQAKSSADGKSGASYLEPRHDVFSYNNASQLNLEAKTKTFL